MRRRSSESPPVLHVPLQFGCVSPLSVASYSAVVSPGVLNELIYIEQAFSHTSHRMRRGIRAFVACLICSRLLAEGPTVVARIQTISGKEASNITNVSHEVDGKLRIAHDAGVWRVRQTELTYDSQRSLGLILDSLAGPPQKLQEVITSDGKKYSGILQCAATPSSLKIIHDSGAATLRFELLPQSVREQFSYDPRKAAIYDQAVAVEEQKAQEKLLEWQLQAGPVEAQTSEFIYIDDGPPNSSTRNIYRIHRTAARALSSNSGDRRWTWVKGYYQDDGTWIPAHYRTTPDSTDRNNWTTSGNKNPFTGELGTTPSVGSYGYGSTYVRPYTRKDGTRVSGHSRKSRSK